MAKWRVELADQAGAEFIDADDVRQDPHTGDYVFLKKDPGGLVAGKVAIYPKGRIKSVKRED